MFLYFWHIFATEERIHSLRSEPLRILFEAALFESGKFLWIEDDGSCPKMVPTENQKLLGSPLGLLINELCFSPEGIIEHTKALLHLSVSLDVGNCMSKSTTEIILLITRFASRLQSAILFLLSQTPTSKYYASLPVHYAFRSYNPTPHLVACLESGAEMLRSILWETVLPIIKAWTQQLRRACEPLTTSVLQQVQNFVSGGIEGYGEGFNQNSNRNISLSEGGGNQSDLEVNTCRLCSLFMGISA